MVPVRFDWKAALAGAALVTVVVAVASLASAATLHGRLDSHSPATARSVPAGWQAHGASRPLLVCDVGLSPLAIATTVASATAAAMVAFAQLTRRSGTATRAAFLCSSP
jgi:hypothetical protein